MAPVADSAVLEEIQYHMLEAPDLGVTWADDMWTATEVIQYANLRQERFLKEAPVLLGRAEIVNSAALAQPLPEDWMITYRLIWKDDNGDRIILPRVDHHELDAALSTWPTGTAAQPQVYADTDMSTLSIHVAPIPTNGGEFEILYVPSAPTLDGLGVDSIFMVPEEFVPYIKYGIMADMYSKNGRAHNPALAAYCEGRFQEGIQMVLSMVRGWV
jgi:hypothetical protein